MLVDCFHPGALPGNALGYPAGQVVTPPQVIAAVQANPTGRFASASTAQTPLPFVVARYTIDPSAESYLAHDFTPTGDLRVPVLPVHNAWDPGVPAFHEAALAQKAAAAGATANLLQRFAPSFGHCASPTSTAMQGFTGTVDWAMLGVKPAS